MGMFSKLGSPFLYDEDTKDIVGIGDPDGSYTPLLSSSEVAARRLGIRTPFAQSAAPIVLLSSATAITATGAISGLTTLPYIPQGVVRVYCFAQTGLAGGLYYARFSSTTACQLYTDAAGTVTPTGITAGAYAGGTSMATLWQTTLPASSMGPNGVITADVLWSGSNTTNLRTTSVSLYGYTFCSNGWSGATTVRHLGSIRNRGTESLQVFCLGDGSVGLGGTAVPVTQATINTAVAQTLRITAQLAAASDFVILEGYTIDVLYGA